MAALSWPELKKSQSRVDTFIDKIDGGSPFTYPNAYEHTYITYMDE